MSSRPRYLKGDVEELIDVARSVAKGGIYGLCAYGSKVAGYARPDSDYDLILVLDGFKERVRYRYVKEPVNASLLVVDRDSFRMDAERSWLGEFVIGRLLNIYDPLINPDFFEGLEVIYKKRTVMEEVYRIVSEYGELAKEFLIHIDYFLFSKLRSRALFYPPALYSYSKTYSGSLRERNLKATRAGFAMAIDELVEKEMLDREGDYVRIREARGSSWLYRLSSLMKMTSRSIAHYLVHGYAGRVWPDVVFKEFYSKVKRVREGFEVPQELKSPKRLWRLGYGELIVADGEDWLDSLAKSLGFDEYEIEEEGPKEFYHTTSTIRIRGEGREERLVVKRFKDIMSIKWMALNIWALASKRFDMSPLARLRREYLAMKGFREIGVRIPELVALVLDERVMVTRYIEGVDLGSVVADILSGRGGDLGLVEAYGELMGRIHSSCYSLGDSKPSNVIVRGGELYITDLEQAGRDGDKAWDIAEFLYFSTKLSLNIDAARELTRAFVKGYLKHGDRGLLRKATGIRYIRPFEPFVSLRVVSAIIQEIRRALVECGHTAM